MLDIIGSIVLSAYCVAEVALLVGPATIASEMKLALLAIGAAWLGLIVAIYATGGLEPGLIGPIPVNFLPFTVVVAGLFGCWVISSGFRRALESVPFAALIAVHGGRVAGIFFLLLYCSGRLSAPFGPAAGLGDVVTGVFALLLAGMVFTGAPVRRGWIAFWNAFGALDLLIAIVLATLSAPGTPFRLFYDAPGTQVLTALPWIFAPAILVPLDLFVHFLIARRLRNFARDVGLITAPAESSLSSV